MEGIESGKQNFWVSEIKGASGSGFLQDFLWRRFVAVVGFSEHEMVDKVMGERS